MTTQQTGLVEIYGALFHMAEDIGNGASVSISLLRYGDLSDDTVAFQVDWPNHSHCRYIIAVSDIMYAKTEAINYIVAYMKNEYIKVNP